MDERTEEEVAQAVMLRIVSISESLTILLGGWFGGMIELDAKSALRGLAVWRIIGEELQELVELIYATFGEGNNFELAVKNQEKEWEAQARRLEELNQRLESLRQNAENN